MAGFRWEGSMDGSEPIIRTFTVKASEVISFGEVVVLDTGEAAAGATNSDAFLGVAIQDVDNTVDGHTVDVIVNPGAIWSVYDANARVAGVTLDLASGGMGLASTSNADFKVWADSADDEPTLVIWTGHHIFGWS